MNNEVESGLLLPIRWYNSILEQDRYKNHTSGFIDENFVQVDCKSLAPFQLLIPSTCEGSVVASLSFVSLVTNTPVQLPYTASDWEYFYTEYGGSICCFVSYLGTGDFTNYITCGRGYLTLAVLDECAVTKRYTSEIFKVMDCTIVHETGDFRIWSASDDDKRLINNSDLRIL